MGKNALYYRRQLPFDPVAFRTFLQKEVRDPRLLAQLAAGVPDSAGRTSLDVAWLSPRVSPQEKGEIVIPPSDLVTPRYLRYIGALFLYNRKERFMLVEGSDTLITETDRQIPIDSDSCSVPFIHVLLRELVIWFAELRVDDIFLLAPADHSMVWAGRNRFVILPSIQGKPITHLRVHPGEALFASNGTSVLWRLSGSDLLAAAKTKTPPTEQWKSFYQEPRGRVITFLSCTHLRKGAEVLTLHFSKGSNVNGVIDVPLSGADAEARVLPGRAMEVRSGIRVENISAGCTRILTGV